VRDPRKDAARGGIKYVLDNRSCQELEARHVGAFTILLKRGAGGARSEKGGYQGESNL
jgi:hypothetical protein